MICAATDMERLARSHGLVDAYQQDGVDGLRRALAQRGWSTRNIARLLGEAPPGVVTINVTTGDAQAQIAPPATVAMNATVGPAQDQGAQPPTTVMMTSVGPAPAPVRPTAPVELDVVPVARLTSPTQIFACAPLAAKLRVGSCIERQRVAQGGAVDDEHGGRMAEAAAVRLRQSFVACADCAQGREIATRLVAAARAARKST